MNKICATCKYWKKMPWNEENWGTCTFSYSHKDKYIPTSLGAAINTISNVSCEEWNLKKELINGN